MGVHAGTQDTCTPAGGTICAALLAAALCVIAVLLAHPPSGDHAATTKPFTTFEDFYPVYLEQHAEPRTKLLHAVGTGIAGVQVVLEPRLAVAAIWSSAASLCMFRLCIGMHDGFAELGVGIATVVLVTRALTGSMRPAVVVLCSGYSFAWAAHRFVEMNRPATFTYPTYSLWGDLRMLGEVMTGAHVVW